MKPKLSIAFAGRLPSAGVRILLSLCLCASVVCSSAQTTPVLFTLQSLTGSVNNRSILVQPDRLQNPLVLGTNLVPFFDFTIQPINGQVLTNLIPWGYTITVYGWPRSAHITVPISTNVVNAATLINTNQFSPLQLYLNPMLGNAVSGSNGATAIWMLGLDAQGLLVSNAVPAGGASTSSNNFVGSLNFGQVYGLGNAAGLSSNQVVGMATNPLASGAYSTPGTVAGLSSNQVIGMAGSAIGGSNYATQVALNLTNNLVLTTTTNLATAVTNGLPVSAFAGYLPGITNANGGNLTNIPATGVIGTGANGGGTNLGVQEVWTVNPYQFGGNLTTNDNSGAFQAMFNYANSTSTAGKSYKVWIPGGTWHFLNTVGITNCYSMSIEGAGYANTILESDFAGAVINTHGFQYCSVKGIEFECTVPSSDGVFDCDSGVAPVQANTFDNCFFAGNGTTTGGGPRFGFWMKAGIQGSENQFINAHFIGCTNGYYQDNYNALDNNFWGGDCQGCYYAGLRSDAGPLHVHGMSFENGYTQGASDILMVNSAYEPSIIEGCRSESLRFLESDTAVTTVIGCRTMGGENNWSSNTTYSVSNLVISVLQTNGVISTTNNGILWRCITAGTSSNLPPDGFNNYTLYPASATIVTEASGVQWQEVYDNIAWGKNVTLKDCVFLYGFCPARSYQGCWFTRPDFMNSANGNGIAKFLGGNYVSATPLVGGTNQNWQMGYGNQGGDAISAPDVVNFGANSSLEFSWPYSSDYGQANAMNVGFAMRTGGAVATDTLTNKIGLNTIGIVGTVAPPLNTNGTGYNFYTSGGMGSNGGGSWNIAIHEPGYNLPMVVVTVNTNGNVYLTNSIVAGGTISASQWSGVNTNQYVGAGTVALTTNAGVVTITGGVGAGGNANTNVAQQWTATQTFTVPQIFTNLGAGSSTVIASNVVTAGTVIATNFGGTGTNILLGMAGGLISGSNYLTTIPTTATNQFALTNDSRSIGLTGLLTVSNNNNTVVQVYGSNTFYAELNVQNMSPAGSSDLTATGDKGTSATNYINVGFNGSGYVPGVSILGSTNDTYLLSVGRNLFEDVVGTGMQEIWTSQTATNAAVVTNMTLGVTGLTVYSNLVVIGTNYGNYDGATNSKGATITGILPQSLVSSNQAAAIAALSGGGTANTLQTNSSGVITIGSVTGTNFTSLQGGQFSGNGNGLTNLNAANLVGSANITISGNGSGLTNLVPQFYLTYNYNGGVVSGFAANEVGWLETPANTARFSVPYGPFVNSQSTNIVAYVVMQTTNAGGFTNLCWMYFATNSLATANIVVTSIGSNAITASIPAGTNTTILRVPFNLPLPILTNLCGLQFFMGNNNNAGTNMFFPAGASYIWNQ